MKKKLITHTTHEAKKRNSGLLISLFVIILMVLDVFLFPISADIRIFTILGVYIVLALRYRVSSNTTFSIALVLLIIAYTQFLFTDQKIFDNPGPVPPLCERTAVWVYLFLVIGVIQKWRE